MPLDNTASIRDIITSLQDLEGINAKADLASVVGSPATADDSMATISNTIQQAKNDLANKTEQDSTEPLQTLVNNMVVGKKWASGVQAGEIAAAQEAHSVIVSGLDFKPRVIVLLNSNNLFNATIYFADVSTTNYLRVLSSSSVRNELLSTHGGYVINGGFKLIVSNDAVYNWIAYE